MNLRFVTYVAVYVLLVGGIAWGQPFNESLKSAVPYVNTSAGSDPNPGTAAQPLRTISASIALAKAKNQSNIGTKAITNPGNYRESILINANFRGQTTQPMTLQAVPNGSVTGSPK